jgi:hypothetical protein
VQKKAYSTRKLDTTLPGRAGKRKTFIKVTQKKGKNEKLEKVPPAERILKIRKVYPAKEPWPPEYWQILD